MLCPVIWPPKREHGGSALRGAWCLTLGVPKHHSLSLLPPYNVAHSMCIRQAALCWWRPPKYPFITWRQWGLVGANTGTQGRAKLVSAYRRFLVRTAPLYFYKQKTQLSSAGEMLSLFCLVQQDSSYILTSLARVFGHLHVKELKSHSFMKFTFLSLQAHYLSFLHMY